MLKHYAGLLNVCAIARHESEAVGNCAEVRDKWFQALQMLRIEDDEVLMGK